VNKLIEKLFAAPAPPPIKLPFGAKLSGEAARAIHAYGDACTAAGVERGAIVALVGVVALVAIVGLVYLALRLQVRPGVSLN